MTRNVSRSLASATDPEVGTSLTSKLLRLFLFNCADNKCTTIRVLINLLSCYDMATSDFVLFLDRPLRCKLKGPALCYGCRPSVCRPSVFRGCTVAKRCKIGPRLLLITNRKSHTNFQMTYTSMTLDDLKAS